MCPLLLCCHALSVEF
uniref:Uncharacterized protein n=1 Tax=Arundo donax TaxID=35708 RepID=A0A0A8ZRX6_ARUDO